MPFDGDGFERAEFRPRTKRVPVPALVASVIIAVSTAPGRMAFTRMPNGPNSFAADRVAPRRPNFDAE